MKTKKVQSLSRKLFVNFILSCLLPIVVVSFLVSYLFGTYQYQEIRSRAENNTKLISAYMTKYLNDIDNLTKAPYYHSFFQSRTPFEDLTPYDQNKVGEEIGKLLQLTTYSREDFGDMLVMSDGNVLYLTRLTGISIFQPSTLLQAAAGISRLLTKTAGWLLSRKKI